ncbi:TPA: hypothetical protein ACH3X1_012928 [Trebouxia sp. C0004]
MGVNPYSDQYGDGEGPYKSVAQIWEEATQQGANYRTLSAKHRYNVVKNCSGVDFIPDSELKKVKSVGQGSFASVDICRYKGGLVAVKHLSPTANPESQEQLESFAREASLLRVLHHRFIVNYIGYGHDKPDSTDSEVTAKPTLSAYIVTENLECGTLRDCVLNQMVNPSKSLYSTEQAVQWLSEIAEALQYLHSLTPAVVHRDLKLENILLRNSNGKEEAVLSDFGLHTLLSKSGAHSPSPDTTIHTFATSQDSQIGLQQGRNHHLEEALSKTMTASGSHAEASRRAGTAYLNMYKAHTFDLTHKTGSFMYMAPEVFKERKYNEKVDVFSFGCVIYELLSRQLTSAVVSQSGDANMAEMYANKVANGYRRPIPSMWPSALRTLIDTCWAEQPEKRPGMKLVVRTLTDLSKRPDELHKLSPRGSSGMSRMGSGLSGSKKGCCVVM